MNSIVIKGRLTNDPETRYTPAGKLVVHFSVAVNRRFNRDQADFFRCTAWEKTGEFVSQYFRKGQEILLSGEMQSSMDDKGGEKRTYWNLVVSSVEFCGTKADRDEYMNNRAREQIVTAPTAQAQGFVPVEIDGSEDLPF